MRVTEQHACIADHDNDMALTSFQCPVLSFPFKGVVCYSFPFKGVDCFSVCLFSLVTTTLAKASSPKHCLLSSNSTTFVKCSFIGIVFVWALSFWTVSVVSISQTHHSGAECTDGSQILTIVWPQAGRYVCSGPMDLEPGFWFKASREHSTFCDNMQESPWPAWPNDSAGLITDSRLSVCLLYLTVLTACLLTDSGS